MHKTVQNATKIKYFTAFLEQSPQNPYLDPAGGLPL